MQLFLMSLSFGLLYSYFSSRTFSIFSIYTDDKTIFACFNGKFDKFDKVKFAANLKNNTTLLLTGAKNSLNFKVASEIDKRCLA